MHIAVIAIAVAAHVEVLEAVSSVAVEALEWVAEHGCAALCDPSKICA